jgi:spore germination protein GerM
MQRERQRERRRERDSSNGILLYIRSKFVLAIPITLQLPRKINLIIRNKISLEFNLRVHSCSNFEASLLLSQISGNLRVHFYFLLLYC